MSIGGSGSPAMRRPAQVPRSPWPEISERAGLARSRCLRLVLAAGMDIYLPIAGQSVNALFIIVLGFLVGLLSGMFGVGGGFLTTPLLIFYGIPPTVAVASAATQITGASVSGVMVHMRRGGVDLKMGGVMIVGGLFGSIVGAALFRLLQSSGQIDVVIGLLYVIILGSIGALMLKDALVALGYVGPEAAAQRRRATTAGSPRFRSAGASTARASTSRRLRRSALGFVAGMLTVLLGIGGGFILVPAMIYLLGMPARVVIGTSLVMILAVSAATTMVHSLTTRSVDIVLAALLLVGGVDRRAIWRATDDAHQARLLAARARDHHPARRPAHVPRPGLAPRRNLLDRISVRAPAPPRCCSRSRRCWSPRTSRCWCPISPRARCRSATALRARNCCCSARWSIRAGARRPARPTSSSSCAAGPADPGARKAEDRRHLDERGFEPLPLGAVLLRRRLLAADRRSWSMSARPRSTSWGCTIFSSRRAAAPCRTRSGGSKPACSTCATRHGLYSENPHGVEITDGVLYRAMITIPSQVPVGTYTAETFLIDRGKVHRRGDPRHPDQQVGFRAVRRPRRAPPRRSSTG